MGNQADNREGAHRHWPPPAHLLIIGIAYLSIHIPFLNQALIIDDGNFVDQALHIIQNPSAPYSFYIHLHDILFFYDYFANPPGFAYYLAAVIKLFGSSEMVLHISCLLFSSAALLAMYALSRKINGQGLYGTLFLLFTPTFLLSSQTVMSDVPAMAFYTLSIFLFLHGMDKNSGALFSLAGLAAGISSLLKYSGVTAYPLMLLYWLLLKKRKASPLLAFTTGGLVFGAWCLASYLIYDKVHIIAMSSYESLPSPLYEKFYQGVEGLLAVGGASIFPLFLLYWSLRSSFGLGKIPGFTSVVGAIAGFSAALPRYYFPPHISYNPTNRVLGAVLLAAGSATLVYIVFCGLHSLRGYIHAVRSKNRPDLEVAARSLMIVCWFLGIFVFNIRLLFSTPKYLVPAIPALILLLTGTTPGTRKVFASFPRWQKIATLATTAVLAVSLCTVDFLHGNAHKKYITEELPELFPDRTIWFIGHWTIRYYSEKMGYSYLGQEFDENNLPRRGDILFVVEESSRHGISKTIRSRLRLLGRQDEYSPLPLHLVNSFTKAGYWSHQLGILPYVITRKPMTSFTTFQFR